MTFADDLTPAALTTALRSQRVGRHYHYYPSTDSTNDIATDLARAGAPEGTLVLAEEQTRGRGRLGRRWLAPARSCLLLSLLLRASLPVGEAFRLTMLCSLAAAKAVRATTGLSPALKWPNDLLLGGKKLAGILSEASALAGTLEWAVVGIGLNVNFEPLASPEIAATATSLQAALGRPVDRLPLLCAFLEEVENHYPLLWVADGAEDSLWGEWRGRLATLGRQVVVREGERRVAGLAYDVGRDGSLLLRRDDGDEVAMAVGDVTLRG
ncbi:MAG: biotin--[acetyl-CoA-carboxylase] ligase [Chloroflexi bacterium]|nr:biotin--[acetyl-CoA-carboxylase] ligase [Chloroflexota bacterium]MCL5110325.1 biotin--[acetyl-CoA-carboxylase] ligase [Chloroflexota bacterium]